MENLDARRKRREDAKSTMTKAHASPSPTTSGRTVALVYIRVSKYDPGDDGRKVSPQTQVDRCRALAPLKDLTVEVFEDLDYSGKNTKRPGFAKMLERAQRGDVTLIACYSVSRLSRSVADLYAILQQLQELDIGFVSATEAIETATPMGKAFLGILAVLAQLEREQISQRVADALAYKRSQGKLLGTLPAGFRRGSDDAITIDPKAASTIRLIFEQYASGGFSFRSLAAWLNGRGIKPIATRGGNGRPPAPLWSGDVLKEILKRPAYAGLVRGPEGLLPGQPPELVDLDTWRRCQDLRVRNRFLPEGLRPRHRASPFPLTPLLRCDHCGGSMRGKQASRSKGVSRYYVCSQRALYGSCAAPIVRADVLEGELCRWLGTCHPDERLEQTARDLVERGLKQRKTNWREWDERLSVKALEARLERTRKLWIVYGDMTETEFRAERVVIEKEIARVRALPEVATVRQCSHRITDVVAAWHDANPDQRARLAAGILSQLHVKDGKIHAIRPRQAWIPYFEELLASRWSRERETSLELATSTLATLRSTN
jgi:site-specific DNA recombinase